MVKSTSNQFHSCYPDLLIHRRFFIVYLHLLRKSPTHLLFDQIIPRIHSIMRTIKVHSIDQDSHHSILQIANLERMGPLTGKNRNSNARFAQRVSSSLSKSSRSPVFARRLLDDSSITDNDHPFYPSMALTSLDTNGISSVDHHPTDKSSIPNHKRSLDSSEENLNKRRHLKSVPSKLSFSVVLFRTFSLSSI